MSVSTAAWLDESVSALAQAIVRRAMLDIGIVELPPGSNRSPTIDKYVGAVGSPAGSRWCAAAVAAWWRDCGADTPCVDGGSCNAWMSWAKRQNLWTAELAPGCAVVYGRDGDATHIGVVVRASPMLLSVEANTSIAGGFDADGIGVTLKRVAAERVLGYITPRGSGAL